MTKLDKKQIILCLETVKYIEAIPDTLITFMNGDSLFVKESLEEIMDHSIALHAKILNKAEALKI